MATEDRQLKILLQIASDVADLTKLTGGVKNLRDELDKTKKSGFSLGDAFKFAGANEALHRVLEVVKEIPTRIYDSIKSGVEFNAEIQQMQIGMAAVLQLTQPGRFGNFDAAKENAGEFIDTIKAKANELGIAYHDMFESVTHTQAQLASAGVTDINKAIELAVLLQRAMQSVGVTATQAGRDIGDILQGQAARTLGGARLASALGMSKEDFDLWIKNLITTGQLYDGLTEKMRPLGDAARAASTTFTASLERMRNKIVDLQAEAAKPVMQPLQEAAEQFVAFAKTDDAKAFARTIGGIGANAIEAAKGIVDLIEKYRTLLSLAAPGLSGITGAFGRAVDDQKEQIHIEKLQQQTAELQKQIEVGGPLEAATAARVTLNTQLTQVQREITAETNKGKDADQGVLSQLFGVRDVLIQISEQFTKIWGSAVEVGSAMRQITPELQKFRDAADLFHAQTYGDEAEVYRAKWVSTYHSISEEAKKAGAQLSENELSQLVYERMRGPERQREITQLERESTLSRDITEYTRQTATVLAQIRGSQNLIEQNPFLSIDQKNSALLQLIPQEMSALNQQIAAGKSLLQNSALDPAQYEQVRQKVIQDTFALEGLRLKLASLGFGGQLRTELTSFVNQFGSGAHQLAGIITGTLNTAIGSTSQALTALIFKTGNWKQAFAQAAQSIVQNIIQIALQFVVSRLLMSALNRVAGGADAAAANAQASGAAAAWAPAATSAAIATEGVAAGVGLAAYLSSLSAGVAGATALAGAGGSLGSFASGGFTGDLEGYRFHKREFVFNEIATRTIGVDRLAALHDNAISGRGERSTLTTSPSPSGDRGQHHFLFVDLHRALREYHASPEFNKTFRRLQLNNRV